MLKPWVLVYNYYFGKQAIIPIKGEGGMDKLEVLKRSDLFRELNDEQLSLVEKMCTAEVYEPGTIIHRANTIINR